MTEGIRPNNVHPSAKNLFRCSPAWRSHVGVFLDGQARGTWDAKVMPSVETWKPVPQPFYASHYSISSEGRVRNDVTRRSSPAGAIKKNSVHQHTGYLLTMLSRDGKDLRCYVHRLVAAAFIPNPEAKERVNHLNRVRTDNRAENLQWVTAKENSQHAFQSPEVLARMRRGEGIHGAKLTVAKVLEIRKLVASVMQKDLAVRFGVDESLISGIVNRRYWRHI